MPGGGRVRRPGAQGRRGAPMNVVFTRKLRLRPTILTLFVLLTVPVFFTIVAVTYLSNDSLARSHANDLVTRFRADAISNIQDMFDPIKSLVRSAAAIGNEQPDFYASNRSLKYLFSILVHSDKIISMYVGAADGSFRQARRIDPNVMIQGKLPPQGSKYAYRWINRAKGATPIDHYVLLDAAEAEIGTSEEATGYDPRPRLWYRRTVEDKSLLITDPDVFAALGLIGFTVAAPFYADGKIAGVAAADITLDGLSEYLSENKISPGTVSYILDDHGGVIANSERAKTYTNKNGRVELQHITSLDDELPAVAYGARPRHGEALFGFSRAGNEYVASVATLPPQFGKQWQLFIITPLRDFTSAFDKHNNRLLVFGLLAIAAQILIIYFLSRVLSSPLERLSLKVARIETLEPGNLPPLDSPIREISVLSKAVDTLDTTIKSFAAFVPVGLVRQLLQSDQKLELGGHSQFLTVFFSDLEAFSTLSEAVPAQDLLLRVSAYLELVTKAVNDEAGTIDKFIGDGVMAFWGAPALLDDHAWRACVAALRIEQGMTRLNERWVAEGHKPLNIRIGLNSDAVLVGNIGSKERMGYTVIGDGVNVAARLEGLNKEYGTHICVSHSVFKEAGERLCVRPIEDVAVRGRRTKIPVYELKGCYGAGTEFEPDSETLRLCRMTRRAYEVLVQEDFGLALERYQEILTEFPEDTVSRELVRRLAANESARPVQRQALR